MRRGVGLLGELIRRGLVLTDVVNVGDDAEFVERAAEEHCVGGDAGKVERARRHQEHFGRGAGQVVVAVTAVFDVGVDRFARLLEIEDGVAQLLDFSPERAGEAGRFEQHGTDARIHLGLAQVVDDGADGRGANTAQVAEDVGRSDFGEIAADAEAEDRVGWHGRLRADHQVEEEDGGEGEDEEGADEGEEDAKTASGHDIEYSGRCGPGRLDPFGMIRIY